MKQAKFNAVEIAQRIARNCQDVSDWAAFSARAFALWDEVAQGEQNIIGSACSDRHMAVHAALKTIQS